MSRSSNRRPRRGGGLAWLAVFLAGSAAWAANPYAIRPSGQKVEGTSVRSQEDGTILLTTASGVLTLEKGTKVVMDEPAGYTRVKQLMQAKQFDNAIVALDKVIKECRFMEWDLKAMRLLPAAYLGKGEFKSAVAAYEKLFVAAAPARDESDIRAGYLKALLGAKESAKLLPMLDETIMKGSREVAADAQMMRARLKEAQGDTQAALSDYMRTAELFTEQEALQPEAWFKTAECLEKLGDPRAKDYYQRVAKSFPASPFAVRAAAKK